MTPNRVVGYMDQYVSMDGSQHNGVFLSMTISTWVIRLLTTFSVDLISVTTPFTVTVWLTDLEDLEDLVVFIT